MSMIGKKVVEAQDRGATLDDFVKLEQVKTKSDKNKLLKLMGTSDFNLEYKRTLEQQENDRLKKLALKELKTFAEPFPENEYTWSSKWIKNTALSYPLLKFEKGKRVPKNKTKKYYYKIWNYSNGSVDIDIYTKNENYKSQPDKPKKTEKQKATDRAVRALNKITKEHYELRKEFIMNLAKCSKIKDYEHICLETIMSKTFDYGYINNNHSYNKILCEFLGTDSLYNNTDKLVEAYNTTPAGTTVLMVYRLLEDSEDRNCYNKAYDSSKVTFRENKSLNRIYDFLTALGYEMSQEEIRITDGTYELYDREENA